MLTMCSSMEFDRGVRSTTRRCGGLHRGRKKGMAFLPFQCAAEPKTTVGLSTQCTIQQGLFLDHAASYRRTVASKLADQEFLNKIHRLLQDQRIVTATQRRRDGNVWTGWYLYTEHFMSAKTPQRCEDRAPVGD